MANEHNENFKRAANPGKSNPHARLRELFREARQQAALDLATVAVNAGVSESTVRMLETTPEKVPLHDFYAVANVLNLDPGTVLELLHAGIR